MLRVYTFVFWGEDGKSIILRLQIEFSEFKYNQKWFQKYSKGLLSTVQLFLNVKILKYIIHVQGKGS